MYSKYLANAVALLYTERYVFWDLLQDAFELLWSYDNSELIILNHQSSSIYSIKLNWCSWVFVIVANMNLWPVAIDRNTV